jgi:transposase
MERSADHPDIQAGLESYLNVIDVISAESATLAKYAERRCSTGILAESFQILRSFPGIGQISGLVILLEIGSPERFARVGDFLSYSRLVTPIGESDGRPTGRRNCRIGNPYLCYALNQAAIHGARTNKLINQYLSLLESAHGPKKARHILAAKYGRSVWHSLSQKTTFDIDKFLGTGKKMEKTMAQK